MTIQYRGTDLSRISFLAVVGPTAVGKSMVASIIAPALNAVVVSVDSMQVYRGMDIGTSKPVAESSLQAQTMMIDVADPRHHYSAATYKADAEAAITGILESGKSPLLVGGTGLYFRAVVDDLDFPERSGGSEACEPADALADRSNEELHEILCRLDPEAAAEIPPGNRRRVLRAITVASRGGRISKRQRSWDSFLSPYRLKVAGLCMDRELLYSQIEERVDRMLEAGFLEEVSTLSEQGRLAGPTAREAIGYKQLLEHLDGRCSLEEAVEAIKRGTRRYAKRQMVWFRKDPRVKWFKVDAERGATPQQLAEAQEHTAMLVLEYLEKKEENE